MSGQAASYYDPQQVFEDPRPAPQPQYNNYQVEHKQPPPYTDQSPPVYDFSQAFRIERPQFHDVWAGLLVSAVRMDGCHILLRSM